MSTKIKSNLRLRACLCACVCLRARVCVSVSVLSVFVADQAFRRAEAGKRGPQSRAETLC